MADIFSTADELTFSSEIRNPLKAVEDIIFTNFHFRPSYVKVNLAKTREGPKSRDYTLELSPIQDKQGLYVIFETPKDNSPVSSILYVGKTGKTGKMGSMGSSDAVFYKTDKTDGGSGGGSGRIPHHIVGDVRDEDTIFARDSKYKRDSKEYHDFVDRYSVLCMIIDSEQIGDHFEELLIWWEAYLVFALMPKMNETLEINFDIKVISSSTTIQEQLTKMITDALSDISISSYKVQALKP